ncbi:MAG: VOC family protein [Arthrobacter sp.]|nr:VOC family protein [Arthrobacter sp.]
MRSEQSHILASLARIHVDDLDAAVPFYSGLTGETPHRFGFRDMDLAKVGSFLLVAGADENVRSHAATLVVRGLYRLAEEIIERGGTLLEGPEPGPNGARLVARHPDGSVVEYIEVP